MKNISTRDLVLVSLFASLTAVLSYVSIPLPFVPITGQTLGVMLSGGLLGSKLGLLSQIIYIILGIIGLPVFSGGDSGIAVILGPSGGFLLGFPIGAFFIGKMLENKQNLSIIHIILTQIVGGIVLIYIPGIIQLSRFVEGQLSGAVLLSLTFIPGDLLKVVISSAAMKSLKSKGIEKFIKPTA